MQTHRAVVISSVLIPVIAFACLVIFTVGLGSCGGSKGIHSVADPGTSGSGGFGIPAPSAIKAANDLPGSKVLNGSAYMAEPAGFSNNVAVTDLSAVFTPDWDSGDPLGGLAYAAYRFDMTSYVGKDEFSLNFSQQGSLGDAWVGFSDFTKDAWRWFELPEDNVINTSLSAFVEQDMWTSNMYVVVLFTGHGTWKLDILKTGNYVAKLEGIVFDTDGVTPMPGVQVTVGNPEMHTTVTNSAGQWSVYIDNQLGNYHVTCSISGFTFDPQQRNIVVTAGTHEVGSFRAVDLPTFTVSGSIETVPPTEGPVFFEIRKQLEIGGVVTHHPVAYDGTYEIELTSGEYKVWPEYNGIDDTELFTYDPEEISFTVAGADVALEPFTATPISPVVIDGYVFLEDGVTPVSNIMLTVEGLSGLPDHYARTNAEGYWNVQAVGPGKYMISLQSGNYEISPEYRMETVGEVDVHVSPFMLSMDRFPVSGYIYENDGVTPVAGVLITFNGMVNSPVRTDANGYYTTPPLEAGSWTIEPVDSRYSFLPADQTVTVSSPETLADFIGTPAITYSVSGYIYETDGITPVEGATVNVQARVDYYVIASGVTDGAGYYHIDGIGVGDYRIEPQMTGYRMEPASVVDYMTTDLVLDDFLAEEYDGFVIDGYIFDDESAPVSDVALVPAGGMDSPVITQSDSSGYYAVEYPEDTTQYFFLQREGYVFDPLYQEYTPGNDDIRLQDTVGYAVDTVKVDGYVYHWGTTAPVAGARLSIYSTDVAQNRPCQMDIYTDETGYFSCNLPQCYSWECRPSKQNHLFTYSSFEFITVDLPVNLGTIWAIGN